MCLDFREALAEFGCSFTLVGCAARKRAREVPEVFADLLCCGERLTAFGHRVPRFLPLLAAVLWYRAPRVTARPMRSESDGPLLLLSVVGTDTG